METRIDEIIDVQIAYIRRMETLTDSQLRALFRKVFSESPETVEAYASQKNTVLNMRRVARNFRETNFNKKIDNI